MPTRADRIGGPGPLSLLDRARLTVDIAVAHRYVKRAQDRTADLREVLAEIRDRPLQSAEPPANRDGTAVRLGGAVSRAMPRMPADSRCLAQSLVLCRLLALNGIAATLVIGVQNDDGFGAHAWVELGGRPLLPPGDFGRLTEL